MVNMGILGTIMLMMIMTVMMGWVLGLDRHHCWIVGDQVEIVIVVGGTWGVVCVFSGQRPQLAYMEEDHHP